MTISHKIRATIKWKIIKKRLGYTDEQMKTFRANQRMEIQVEDRKTG